MKRKFFFFNIDGTLTIGIPSNQYNSESTKLALSKFKEAGQFLAIAIGRRYAMAVAHMKQLVFENMVSDRSNGIRIANKLIGIESLDYEKCLALIDVCIEKNISGLFVMVIVKKRLVLDRQFYNFIHDIYMDIVVQEELDCHDLKKIYVACFALQEQKLQNLKDSPWCRFHKEYIFVEPGDKSIDIKKLVDYFNGDYQDIVVFEDEKKNLSMFSDEWISIAMRNAIKALKQKAVIKIVFIMLVSILGGLINVC